MYVSATEQMVGPHGQIFKGYSLNPISVGALLQRTHCFVSGKCFWQGKQNTYLLFFKSWLTTAISMQCTVHGRIEHFYVSSEYTPVLEPVFEHT